MFRSTTAWFTDVGELGRLMKFLQSGDDSYKTFADEVETIVKDHGKDKQGNEKGWEATVSPDTAWKLLLGVRPSSLLFKPSAKAQKVIDGWKAAQAKANR